MGVGVYIKNVISKHNLYDIELFYFNGMIYICFRLEDCQCTSLITYQ